MRTVFDENVNRFYATVTEPKWVLLETFVPSAETNPKYTSTTSPVYSAGNVRVSDPIGLAGPLVV